MGMMGAVPREGGAVPDWADASCRDVGNPERWFPVYMHHDVVDPLRQECWTCPRRDDCLAWAIDNQESDGIWGGMTDSQRRRISRGHTDPDTEWAKYHRRRRDTARRQAARQGTRPPAPPSDVDLAYDILADTADRYGIGVDTLVGRSVARDIVTVRHLAMQRIRRTTGLSFSAIGRIFERDHSTVVAAVNGKCRT